MPTNSPIEIAERLATTGHVPSEAEVHGQGIWFYPRHWIKHWPVQITRPELPVLSLDGLDDRGRRRLDRADLFRLGLNLVTPEDAMNFFVAVYSWGTGTKAQRIVRGLRVLEAGDADRHIHAALEALRLSDFDPTIGYEAFEDAGVGRLKYLGPAFFTKLMYFYSRLRAGRATKVPLILDRHVATALGWSNTTGWTAEQYSEYINTAAAIASQLGENVPGDVVEYMLFNAGRTGKLEVAHPLHRNR